MGILERQFKRLEKYFILVGGIALIIGLAANTNWWPWRVRVIYHDPIVYVDWGKFISALKNSDPAGEWGKALAKAGMATSADHLGWVVYRLQWHDDSAKSVEYLRKLRARGGRVVTPEMMNDWMISGRLQAAKRAYEYKDADTLRTDLGETFNPFESSRFIASLTQVPSLAIMQLAPRPNGNAGKDFLIDVFYGVGEQISDKLQRSHFYESLRSASIFGSWHEGVGRRSAVKQSI